MNIAAYQYQAPNIPFCDLTFNPSNFTDTKLKQPQSQIWFKFSLLGLEGGKPENPEKNPSIKGET